ncbi:hypothetical protein M0805_009339 [Coniferiporia weirii]|nr:hypothetical protein M0805_009339 [Coniferiporia weirii]
MLLVDMSNSETGKGKPLNPAGPALISPARREKKSLVELKNGRVLFRQKVLSCEKMSETMQETVKFRDFLEERIKEGCPPLQSIPDGHIPLIAKLVYESDKTINSLAKHIQGALQPEELESVEVSGSNVAPLTLSAIESAIVSVADRVNYGVDWTERTSAALCIWRWEVKEQKIDLLPKTGRDKLEARIAERKQAKRELRLLYEALPQSEKDSLMKSGKKTKAEGTGNTTISGENKQTGYSLGDGCVETKSVDALEIPDSKKDSLSLKGDKIVDPERSAKEKERAEKKAAKEEKERKEKEAQNKSRSIMSAFFKKPKASSGNSGQPPSYSPQESGPSSSKSDFEKAFKPFVMKKDATMAPINLFEQRKKGKEVIVIDHDTSDSLPKRLIGDVSQAMSGALDPQGSFSEFIINVSPKLCRHSKIVNSSGLYCKSSPSHCVRDVFSRLSEAEVLGDISSVRSLQSLLKSRSKIPVKVMIFHEDTRPGYFGTFTKSSTVVGPRTPYAKDAVAFDYSYDSGEEWEEEEEGGDDLMDLTGSDAGESSDLGSELDDWLVDDDDNDLDPGTPLSGREGSPALPPSLPGPEPPMKRKSIKNEERKEPKKRKVMPLLPFSKGPCWENVIGECSYEPFKQHRIQLFNDTPFPIDPFTFVSTPVDHGCGMPTKPNFAVPTLPSHAHTVNLNPNTNSLIAATQPPSSINNDIGSSASTSDVAKRKAVASPAPKNPFPDVLLPYLADKITALASANLTWLVESLYQDLKAHKVKKNAIEAKVREVGEKCPHKRVWIVKGDVLKSLGRMPTVPNA